MGRLFRVYIHETFANAIKLQITMASLRTPMKIDTILSTFTDENKEKIGFIHCHLHIYEASSIKCFLSKCRRISPSVNFFFILHSGGGGKSKQGPLDTSATRWPIVSAPGDYDDGEFGGMKIGRGNRSSRRIPAPAPLARTRAAAMGSQRLTA
jgi:hypothetical protein